MSPHGSARLNVNVETGGVILVFFLLLSGAKLWLVFDFWAWMKHFQIEAKWKLLQC